MTAKNQTIELYRGDDLAVEIAVDDGATPPAPKSVAGAALTWRASATPFSATLIEKTTGGAGAAAITIAGASNELVRFALVPADTRDLSGELFHELQAVDAGGKTRTLATGTLRILPDLVR